MQKEIYLDNSATTRPLDAVIDHMSEVNRNTYGNPSSLHKMGIEAEKLIKAARNAIADSLQVEGKEIYFTSGGTEANNLAILGALAANPRKGRHIVTTAIEHPSVLEVYKNLEKRDYQADYVGVDATGRIDLEELKAKINEETALISVMLVNNEIGTLQPVDEVISLKNSIKKDILIHVDAIQAYGKIRVLPRKSGIDLLSVSAHKIHGPKGVGALFVDKNAKIGSIVFGGGQEASVRSGTENVPAVSGFGLAAQTVCGAMDGNYQKVKTCKERFIQKLQETGLDCKIVTPDAPDASTPYILNVAFSRLRAEVLLHHLEEKGIYVSTGSACSSRKSLQSHVLKAVGLEEAYRDGAIRFSFSSFTEEEEICAVVQALKEIIPKIQFKRGGSAWKR